MQKALLAAAETSWKTQSYIPLKARTSIHWTCVFYQTCNIQTYRLDRERIRSPPLPRLALSQCMCKASILTELSFPLTTAHTAHTSARGTSRIRWRGPHAAYYVPQDVIMHKGPNNENKDTTWNVTGLLESMEGTTPSLSISLSDSSSAYTVSSSLSVGSLIRTNRKI